MSGPAPTLEYVTPTRHLAPPCESFRGSHSSAGSSHGVEIRSGTVGKFRAWRVVFHRPCQRTAHFRVLRNGTETAC